MSHDDVNSKATDAVHKKHPSASEFAVTSAIPKFLDGSLLIVSFVENETQSQNYVYLTDKHAIVYLHPEEAIRAAIQDPDPQGISIAQMLGVDKVLKLSSVSGTIAILISATICILTIRYPDQEVPDILGHALSVILGFYFGSKLSQKN